MVTAFVLINVQDEDVHGLAASLAELRGVAELHLVAGEYDMVAVVRVASNAALSQLITQRIVPKTGVARTKTLFSLECFSDVDLDVVFGGEM